MAISYQEVPGDTNERGEQYVVITLESGATIGKYVRPGHIDEDVQNAAEQTGDVPAPVQVPNAAIDAQIASLEGAPMFLSRPIREFTLAQILYNHLLAVADVENPMLASDEVKAQGIAELTDVDGQYFNKGFSNMKALDDQIRALRAQRT
jgi:hypothetical protein